MGLNINTNVPAIQAGREARRSNSGLSDVLAKLSSQRRINRAADDAAGLAIAERFNTQVRQGQVEANSLQSGINVAQTADSGLSVQQEAVQRIRELSLRAQNGTLNDENRAALNREAQQLREQIDRIAQDTSFNGQTLLNGGTTIDLGTEGENEITIGQSTSESLGLDTLDISTAAGASAAVESADAALDTIAANRAAIGAQQHRFESAIRQREVEITNQQEAEASIRDLDIARASVERARNEILHETGLSVALQANVTPQSALRLLGT